MTSSFSVAQEPNVEKTDPQSDLSPRKEGPISPRGSKGNTSKEHKDILKALGLPPDTDILYAISCKAQLPSWKKSQSATMLCSDTLVAIHCKGLSRSQAVMLLQNISPPSVSELGVVFTNLLNNLEYHLTFRSEEKCNQTLLTITRAKEILSNKLKKPSQENRGHVSEILGEDWYSLLTQAEIVKYNRGDIFVNQGESVNSLYQVFDGHCDVVIEQFDGKNGRFQTLGNLGANHKF